MSGTPLLEVTDLDLSYGQRQVLFGVSLHVDPGEVVALLGTNGAGKSTLLRALSGLARPTRGVIRFAGEDLSRASPEDRVRRGLVQVPGGRATFPGLTVEENLSLGGYTLLRDRVRYHARRLAVLDTFPQLVPLLERQAGALSGGEQQLLAVAKGLLLEPRLLCIDELSLGLAPAVVEELVGVVAGLRALGTTVVIVEQSVNVALTVAHRALFMEKGEVRFQGAAADLLERDDLLRAVFLGARSPT